VGVADGNDGYAEFPCLHDRLCVGEWVGDEDELSVDVARVEGIGERTWHEPTHLRDRAGQLAELLDRVRPVVLARVDDGVLGAGEGDELPGDVNPLQGLGVVDHMKAVWSGANREGFHRLRPDGRSYPDARAQWGLFRKRSFHYLLGGAGSVFLVLGHPLTHFRI